jgi:C4-dicarboxylate transporter DctQ subunit
MVLLTKLLKIYDHVINVAAVLAGILLLFLMTSVCWEVTSRDFFGHPTSWVVEVAGYILLYIPFLAAAWVLKEDGHVRTDLILNLLSGKTRSLIDTITSFVSAVVCLVLSWFALKFTIYLYQVSYKTPTFLMVPKSMMVGVIFLGFLLLSIQFLRRTSSLLKAWKSR